MVKLEFGDVYRVYIDSIDPPHFKYCVCVDPPKCGFFFINTENRRIYDCIVLKRGKKAFLQRDRYISCNFIRTIERSKLTNATFKGKIEENDIIDIYNHVVHSDILTKPHQERIIKSVAEWKKNK